jgi:hypothetical protein
MNEDIRFEHVLEETHVKLIWNYLHEKFGFDLKGWKAKFEEFRREPRVLKSGHDNLEVSHFFLFGNKHIEPVLNQILCRKEGHATFNNLVYFVVTGKKKEVESRWRKLFGKKYDRMIRNQ